jgi:hypothetical protein
MPGHFDCWCTLQKMNLQEAFQLYKYDLISRSRQRLRDIKLREARRKVEADIKIKAFVNMRDNISRNRAYNYDMQQRGRGGKQLNFFAVDRACCRPSMTTQEIKQQTRKKYQSLPEVRQKQVKKKLEAERQKNRIKSDIYKKVRFSFIIL